MNEPKKTDRRMPYELPEEQFTTMREQIRRHTTGRGNQPSAMRRPQIRIALAAAAVVIVAGAGLLLTELRSPHPRSETADLEQMLSTAPTETIRQAAAENYDAIIYDQQL